MSPECLFMVYDCPLCALTPRPQIYFLLHFTCYLAIILFFWLLLMLYFFVSPCIPGHGAFRGGIRVLNFHFVFIGE